MKRSASVCSSCGMGKNVVSGELRKAISVLYRTCQPMQDQDGPVRHDCHNISSLQEAGLSAKPEDFPHNRLGK
jgi:hypothetical protein